MIDPLCVLKLWYAGLGRHILYCTGAPYAPPEPVEVEEEPSSSSSVRKKSRKDGKEGGANTECEVPECSDECKQSLLRWQNETSPARVGMRGYNHALGCPRKTGSDEVRRRRVREERLGERHPAVDTQRQRQPAVDTQRQRQPAERHSKEVETDQITGSQQGSRAASPRSHSKSCRACRKCPCVEGPRCSTDGRMQVSSKQEKAEVRLFPEEVHRNKFGGVDCGRCAPCRDKPKFGGEGRMKQACVKRGLRGKVSGIGHKAANNAPKTTVTAQKTSVSAQRTTVIAQRTTVSAQKTSVIAQRPSGKLSSDDSVIRQEASHERIAIWDHTKQRKIGGQAAPSALNLAQYLQAHPDRVVYDGQDPALDDRRRPNKELQQADEDRRSMGLDPDQFFEIREKRCGTPGCNKREFHQGACDTDERSGPRERRKKNKDNY